ncbi:MAG: imelysin family protein [Boseongicola sp. SB0675_bin_26]|nr:imelysin family protein [Boseongicola sp. SB0675_bin_26]
MRIWISAIVIHASAPALAAGPDLQAIVETHVLPGYRTLADEADALASAASSDCRPESPALRAAYHDAFDAWIAVSHLRFGPSEHEDRAFALAFWPDPRGSTPKSLAALLRDEDPIIDSRESFATVSVAARGFHALEFLLFDAHYIRIEGAAADYRCALIQAVCQDISINAAAILGDWQNGYADLIGNPGNDSYRSPGEAARQFFTALSTGLEFTSGIRLGRPMGTFDRPRPKRAEARRSGRSLRHVMLSLESTQGLATLLAGGDEGLERAFETAIGRATELDDPVFAGVADPQGRLRFEVLKQDIDDIRRLLAEGLGPSLGIAAGFNALDGD